MSELDELNLRNWVIERKGYSISGIICLSLIHVILFPLFLTGWITNFIPYTLTQKLTKNVKDLQFLNSFRFGLAIVFFLIYFIAVIILIGALTGPAWIPWSAAAGMFFCGYFALNYLSSIKKIKAAIRFRIMKRKEDSTLKSLIGLHEEIITEMNSITDQFMKAILPGKDGGQKFK